MRPVHRGQWLRIFYAADGATILAGDIQTLVAKILSASVGKIAQLTYDVRVIVISVHGFPDVGFQIEKKIFVQM